MMRYSPGLLQACGAGRSHFNFRLPRDPKPEKINRRWTGWTQMKKALVLSALILSNCG
jgi:hypothetical protein